MRQASVERPLQREQPLRATLDEQDDEHQDHDLAEHGAHRRLDELVTHAESERRDHGPGQLPDATGTTTMNESMM